MAELQERSKIGEARPSDVVESLQFSVKWEPAKGALGVVIPPEFEVLMEGELMIVSSSSVLHAWVLLGLISLLLTHYCAGSSESGF